MPAYDFSTLSPLDFENLSRDLLQAEWGVHLESFRTGRDGGVDFRYAPRVDTPGTIVQCKHYARSGFSQLKSALSRTELPKIKRLNPSRYVLTTSVGLAAHQKDELTGILAPYCRTSGDIFGSEDLNNLLGKHPDVEKRHFKLWLPSSAVLERLLNAGMYTQTNIELDEIQRQISLFVPTEAVERAQEMLDKYGVCLLTGIPGIGKTTTARVLVALHLDKNWQAFYLSSRARDAFEVFKRDENQLFFYDDFLGQTSLEEKLQRNEDKELLQLINACRRNPQKKRFILTTREYLLQQARNQHELLSRSNVEMAQCAVMLSDYSETIRAQILVNHLHFYGVSRDVCLEFVSTGTARQVVDHPNYNPRIIETICELQQAQPLSPREFTQRFVTFLDNPDDIWQHAYENQLSQDARELLLVFAILGNQVAFSALKHTWLAYARCRTNDLLGFEDAFRATMKELEGCFVDVHVHGELTYVAFHNPSIKDFTDKKLRCEAGFLQLVLYHFTHSAPVVAAARYLVESSPDQVTGSEIIDAMRRCQATESIHVDVRVRRVIRRQPATQAERLREWARIADAFGDREAIRHVLVEIETYFQQCSKSMSPAAYFIALYQAYRELAKANDFDLSVLPDGFVAQVLEYCNTPDEFVDVHRLLEDCHDPQMQQATLEGLFSERVSGWVCAKLERAQTLADGFESIRVAKEAADLCGVDQSRIDYESDCDRIGRLERFESGGSVLMEIETIRLEQDARNKSIDDILWSIVG